MFTCPKSHTEIEHIDGLVQERRNTIANACRSYVFLALTHQYNGSALTQSNKNAQVFSFWL